MKKGRYSNYNRKFNDCCNELPSTRKKRVFLPTKPHSETVFTREYLGDCINCLNFDFDNCQMKDDVVIDICSTESDQLDGMLDDNSVIHGERMFEFVDDSSYVSLIYHSMHLQQLTLFLLEKRELQMKKWTIANVPSRKENITSLDAICIQILLVELKIASNLKLALNLTMTLQLCHLGKIFELFVEIDEMLAIM